MVVRAVQFDSKEKLYIISSVDLKVIVVNPEHLLKEPNPMLEILSEIVIFESLLHPEKTL